MNSEFGITEAASVLLHLFNHHKTEEADIGGLDFVSYSWKVLMPQAGQDIQLVLKLYSLFCIL
jgi:hypothetical protein